MASTSSISRPPTPPAQDPGFLMNMDINGGSYKLIAFVQEANGTKTYLPDTLNPQALEKVKELAWGLFNAHDSRRKSLKEDAYAIHGIDARGLIKKDNTVISHDFTLSPVTPPTFPNQMAETLTRVGRPMQPAALKAKDIWDGLSDFVQKERGNRSPSTTSSSSAPSSTTATSTSSASSSTSTSSAQTPNPPAPPVVSFDLPPAGYPVTSTHLDLRGLRFDTPNWYDQIPPRVKLRIVDDCLNIRAPSGGVWAKVWNHFNNGTAPVLERLREEKQRLEGTCRTVPTQITPFIRRQSEQLIDAHRRPVSNFELIGQINNLMGQDFPRKDELYDYIRQQAQAEGFHIHDWARQHFLEDSRHFVQALSRWLDNQ